MDMYEGMEEFYGASAGYDVAESRNPEVKQKKKMSDEVKAEIWRAYFERRNEAVRNNK